jgi:hypothetical protein
MSRRGKENAMGIGVWNGCEAVELRLAGEPDARALRRLSQLDTTPLPPGPYLVAVRDGHVDAALSLATNEAVADPFKPTAGLVELLRLRACAERPVLPGRGSPRRPRPVPRLVTP